MLLLLLPTAAAADASDDVFGVACPRAINRIGQRRRDAPARRRDRLGTAGCTYMYLRYRSLLMQLSSNVACHLR